MKILQDLSSGFFLTNDVPRKDTWKIVQDFQGPFPRTSLMVPTLYVWLSTLKITRLKFGSNCNYSSYVLGSSSIWMCRISNICFDFFNCACLRKTITNIWNSTSPNRWATKDITDSFDNFWTQIVNTFF